MNFDVGELTFSKARYDDIADVLYLSMDGTRGEGEVTTFGTAEGHAVRVDDAGRIVGLTLVNARWLAQRSGQIVISVPSQTLTVAANELGAAVSRAES
jgi:uncharacterized protein YuzE